MLNQASNKKDTYYFSHDANARNDIKMIKLRRSLGLEGYGIYFCLIEMLREQKDFRLLIDDIDDFAFALGTSSEKIKVVIFSFDLFIIEENTFFSSRLLRSMENYNSLKQKRIEAGRKGGQANVKQTLSKRQANVNDCLSIKGNEIKGNEIKLNNIKLGKVLSKQKHQKSKFIPPTLQEILDYVSQKKYSVDANRFYEYFNEGNWIDSQGKQVRNWKQKLITWENHKNNGGSGRGKEDIYKEQPWLVYGITKEEYYSGGKTK